MALDWDNIVIKTDEYSYSLDSEQRMIIFEGQPGAMGPSGGVTIGSVETLPAGSSATVTNTGTFSSAILNFGIPKGDPGENSAVWGAIGGTLSDQTDLDNALASKADTADLGDMAAVDDAPSDGEQYARKNGTWEQVQASSTPAWGNITGTLSNQTDLSNALASKANTADLGDLATVDDAPSDNKNYARKNGTWSEVTGGGGGGSSAWGDITGTLSDQTDLQAALDLKTDLAIQAYPLPKSSSQIFDGIIYYDANNNRFQSTIGNVTQAGPLADVIYFLLGRKANINGFAPALPTSGTIDDGLYYDASRSRYVLYRNGSESANYTLESLLQAVERMKIDDAPSDGAQYARKDGQWTVVTGGGGGGDAAWGGIVGTLSNQTDLQTELDGKAPVIKGYLPQQVSGITVTVPSDSDFSDIKIKLDVSQSGTGYPSSDNIRPFQSENQVKLKIEDFNSDDISGGYLQYTINLPISLYAGIIDLNRGIVTVTHEHIQSYNGETIPGIWYSDRNIYMDGTTPSIGAEVVYKLVKPFQVNIEKRIIDNYKTGQYLIFSTLPDSGMNRTISLVYSRGNSQTVVDTKGYVDAKEASLGLMAYADDAPTDNSEYVRKNGGWAISTGGGGGGTPVWGNITGTLSNQTDLNTALSAKANSADLGDLASEDDAPSDGAEYVRKNGQWSVSSGGGSGSASWGSITGTLSNQNDLKSALDDKADTSSVYSKTQSDALLLAKANTADLGDMATENDAPSDGSEYVRKNGAWAVSSGGSGGTTAWGDITGTLSNQTDLNTALSGKADASSVYTKTEADNLLSAKANTADLGDLAAEDDAPSDNNQYARKNGTWDQISTPAWGAISGTLANQTDLQSALNAKQNTLTLDSTPTAGSTNPVTSSGIKSAIDTKADLSAVYSKSEADTLLSAKANTADLGGMASEDDAPSNDSEYVRKNGAWTVASGSSGIPSGGTIGQVLAKRSDADGDVGWFSLSNLPRRKWYLLDGITETDVIAAYQFVSQPNEATALLNINDGEEYPLTKVLGSEKWSANRGFYIPGSQNAGLTNGTLVGLYNNMLSAAFGYSGASTSENCSPGIMPNKQRVLELASYTDRYTGKPTISAYSGTSAYLAGEFSGKGVLSGNWDATPKMYRDGIALTLSKSGTIFSSGRGKLFGHLNDTGKYSSCYITALVIYNIALNASQHIELANNIYELGGAD